MNKPKKRQYTFLYPPTIDWTWVFQRPQQLMRAFVAQGHRVIYHNVNPKPCEPKLYELEPDLFISNDINLVATKPIQDLVLWITHSPQWALKSILNPSITVFDYIDEVIDEFKHWSGQLDNALKVSDAVFCTSQRLLDITKPKHGEVHLSRNGADFDHFVKAATEPLIQPLNMSVLPRPIIGFYGCLQTWIDFDLIHYVARHRPKWSIALLGPVHVPHKRVLGNLPNIKIFGEIDYNLLPFYARSFDVAIIPFEVRTMTESSCPIKMFEYMAAGLPIVATNIHEATIYPGVVKVGKTYDDFIAKIEEALREKNDVKRKNLAMRTGEEHSWKARAIDILEVLDRVYETKADSNDARKKRSR